LWLLAALLVLEMQAISIQQVAVDRSMQQEGNAGNFNTTGSGRSQHAASR
jgi:hypothetical protein